MWGASLPTIYYGFYDDLKLQALYSTMVGHTSLFGPIRR